MEPDDVMLLAVLHLLLEHVELVSGHKADMHCEVV